MAEQFVEILAREKILVEQNARLEERARLSQDLQAKGLTTALRDYVTTWSRQCRIAADLSLPETCLLSLAVEEALWRVTQEALSNVARHSGASLVQLHLEWTEQHVSLYVSDHGQGFEVNAHEHTGFGLRSIRERIEQAGGTMLIQSAIGAGTRIAVDCLLLYTTGDTSSEHKVTT